MSRVRTVVAWALVVVWLVATVLGVRNAVVESTYADLRAGLDSGEITEVVVVGDVSPPGRGTVEVQWDGSRPTTTPASVPWDVATTCGR